MTPVISKAQLDTIAITMSLGGEFVKSQMDAGKTLTEISKLPVFAAALAQIPPAASKAPAKPLPVEPAMPVMKVGEKPEDYIKRVQDYGKAYQAYCAELKALTSRKREWSVSCNLTKGTFNIAVPDGSIWLSADGLEELVDNFDELCDIREGKVEVKCKLDVAGEKSEDKGMLKVTMAQLRDARAAYRKSEAGKAASEARRSVFKQFATR